MNPICPRCASANCQKNGKTYHQKPRFRCKDCRYQFTDPSQYTKIYISEATQTLVKKLLLDRSSLAGIRRATGVSENWLLNFIKKEYAAVPADLNAQTTMPTPEVYEMDNMDNVLTQIAKKKS